MNNWNPKRNHIMSFRLLSLSLPSNVKGNVVVVVGRNKNEKGKNGTPLLFSTAAQDVET